MKIRSGLLNKEIRSIRALRESHAEEAAEWANGCDLRAENVRKACLYPAEDGDRPRPTRKQRHCLPPRQRCGHVGRNCQTVLCRIGNTNPVTFAVAGLFGQEKRRKQNHLHLAHHLSPHHAFDLSTHQSMGMSRSLVSGILRSRASQRSEPMLTLSAGIELAHRKGQCVIHFLWDMRKI